MPVAGSCGSEDLANSLLQALIAGKEFTFPAIDLETGDYALPVNPVGHDQQIVRVTNNELTTRTVGGTGTFDAIMASINAHLAAQFDKGRITGEQYTKAYIELTSAALGNAVQFLLGRDQAYFSAITAKLQAQMAETQLVESRVKLKTSKIQLQMMLYESQTAEATYALAKMKLSAESVNYCTAKYNLENVLPVQKILMDEQVEAARAQTLTTRRDGSPITGTLGKQRDLYDQQITSYQRDAEVKVGKIFSDAWITMKTLDEGLLPPTGFTNASLDTILTGLKTNVGLNGP